MTPHTQNEPPRGWIAYCAWAREQRDETRDQSEKKYETVERQLDQHD